MIVGNIALVQVQATVASFLVAMFAVSVGAAMTGEFYFENMMLLTASAMFTATSSCFVLGRIYPAIPKLYTPLTAGFFRFCLGGCHPVFAKVSPQSG